jgi:hypothetical protein
MAEEIKNFESIKKISLLRYSILKPENYHVGSLAIKQKIYNLYIDSWKHKKILILMWHR